MLVSVIADAIAMRYLPNSIMTEKLARRGSARIKSMKSTPLNNSAWKKLWPEMSKQFYRERRS